MTTAACPFSRHFRYSTGQYSIELDYATLTIIMDAIFEIWDHVEKTKGPDEATGDAFEALVERIGELREWTGWGGVPVQYVAAPVGADNGPWGER